MTATPDLPASVKEQLLELARRLPQGTQRRFLSRAADRLRELALTYPDTMVFAVVGWLLGAILDQVLSVQVPFSEVVICLTGGRLSLLGAAAGALFGLRQDLQRQSLRQQVAQIVGEELQQALGGGTVP